MERKKAGAKYPPRERKRVYRRRRPRIETEETMPQMPPGEHCLWCNLRIPLVARMALQKDRPEDEWQYHPEYLKRFRQEQPAPR